MDAYRINDSIEQATVSLARHEMTRIEDGKGATISVAYGSIWLTQANNIDDVCLEAGESYRIGRDGVTVVSAFKPSMIVVTPFEPDRRVMRVAMVKPDSLEAVELFATGRKPSTSWFDRCWTRLFVPSSCPTTAAL
jgi:hypothetical protein